MSMRFISKILFLAVAGLLCVRSSIFAMYEVRCRAQLIELAHGGVKLTDAEILHTGQNFENYFRTVDENVLERSYITYAAKLALLSREHLLMMGPPGNAKSLFARMAYSHIKDEMDQSQDGKAKPSYFKTQMTSETTLADTHGQINFKALEDKGVVERLYDQGILGHYLAFLDEIFDISPRALRNILDVLAERAHGQNGNVYQGKIWSVIMASNRYISQVYERFGGGNEPQAVLDRVAFATYVPPDFEFVGSYRKMIRGEQSSMPDLSFQEISALQAKTKEVKVPEHLSDFLSLMVYKLRPEVEGLEETSRREHQERVANGERPLPAWRATKYMSLRTLGKAANVLRAIVVLDWIQKNGERPLTATLEDLQKLEVFFTLGGPSDEFVENELARSTDPHERAQLETIKKERVYFREFFENMKKEFNDALQKVDLASLADSMDSYSTMLPKERSSFLNQLRDIYLEAEQVKVTDQTKAWDLSPEKIASNALSETIETWLEKLEPKKKSEILKSWASEREDFEKRKAEAERKAAAAGGVAATPPLPATPAARTPTLKSENEVVAILSEFATKNGINPDIIKRANPLRFEFALIKAGKFKMGSTKKTDPERSSDEDQVDVTISKDFEIGKTAWPQLGYSLWKGENPSKFKDQTHTDNDYFQLKSGLYANVNHPVEMVSWEDAQAFIQAYNAMGPKKRIRLPFEAEQEMAIRGGTTTQYSFGTDPNLLSQYAFFDANSQSRTHAVGLLKPNPFGLFDVHGNVWEWGQDWYDGKLLGGTDPTGPTTGSLRVLRGGSWGNGARGLRSAYRSYAQPGARGDFLGFRLVRDIP